MRIDFRCSLQSNMAAWIYPSSSIRKNHRRESNIDGTSKGLGTLVSWQPSPTSRLSCSQKWKGLLPNAGSSPNACAKVDEPVPSDVDELQGRGWSGRYCSEDSSPRSTDHSRNILRQTASAATIGNART